MEINIQTFENVEIVTKREVGLRKLFNLIGIFIFGGLALSIVTNPIPSNEIKGFLQFILGSAIVYYFLVNMYFIGHIGRIIFFSTLILLNCFSLYMVYYSFNNAIPH